MAADGPKPGFLGNLNETQEAKLQQMWSIVLKAAEHGADGEEPRRNSTIGRTSTNLSDRAGLSSHQQQLMSTLRAMGMGNNEAKSIQKSLSSLSPSELRQGILDTLKMDHPDVLLLRFLRARKWDIPKAFNMMMNATVWRIKEQHVDDDVLFNGELHALKQSRSSNAKEKKAGTDLLAQMRMGKSYVHATDKVGRPICVVRVRLHKPGAQTEETLERYIVHVIESVRLTLQPPVETSTVLFDMTGFTLGNMEYPPVKFILKCFEANYPESLGMMLIHNAPWVFSGIWKLIRGWMDPDIAAKVQFTNSVDDLAQFVDRDSIPAELGGDDKWSYEYIEPDEKENDIMADTITRDALKTERVKIGEEFLDATAAWIAATKAKNSDEIQSNVSQRAYLAERLRVNYWKLDPYVRARLCLDRERVVQPGGKVEFYPKPVSEEELKTLEVEHLESVNGQTAVA